MELNSLSDVYVHQLKDMYSAEKQLVDALPAMAEAASASELQDAFQHHLTQTKAHLEAVHSILDDLDENPGNNKCEAMAGLIEEGNEIAQEDGDADAKDAALIVAGQKVEHYEIASYGSLHTFAKSLGHDKAAQTLQNILDEEYEADQKLDDLAMGVHGLNKEAKG